MMKYAWMIVTILLVFGCDLKKEIYNRKQLRDKSTISESFYLLTVVHDEHLFIIRDECGILHHPNCPCIKKIEAEKTTEPMPPIIFINPLKN